MVHPGHISRNKSDRRVLKKSQGRPYETSCNTFCKSFKQIDVYISPKNIELYTIHCIIQAVMYHTGHILCNKNDRRVLKKSQGRPNIIHLFVSFLWMSGDHTSSTVDWMFLCFLFTHLYSFSDQKLENDLVGLQRAISRYMQQTLTDSAGTIFH